MVVLLPSDPGIFAVTIGVDVGGTFTDIARWDGARLTTAKLPTTPNQSVAVAEGARRLAGSQVDRLLLHGTTVATNTLLERRGARTILVTNEGFEDLIEIARQDRPSLYDSMDDRPRPLVEREDRYGVDPGIDLAELLEGSVPESIAIAFLNSYFDPAPEIDLASRIEALFPAIPVSVSHRVSGEFREYERISTTTLNAYLRPPVSVYLSALHETLTGVVDRVLVMRSSGGLASIESAVELAASIVLSGPAAGVVAAAACGSAHGWSRVISFDMGGTSTDVCRIEDGRPEISSERSVAGIACRLPSVAVHSIGAGGGSIGWGDPGGALRVGPQSAGANPGPACYGLGGVNPTVTDANLVAGRLGSEGSLAGGIVLDGANALTALEVIGNVLDLDPAAVAAGMLEVVDGLMEQAIRKVSIEQGADPRQAPLLAFGGAGGLHAVGLAKRLDMPAVLIPPHAGVFSALGLLLSPARHDLARTVVMPQGSSELSGRVREIQSEAIGGFQHGTGSLPDTVELRADLRYPGQSHETQVILESGDTWEVLARRFHEAHQIHNGFSRFDQPVELVTLRAAAISRPVLEWSSLLLRVEDGEARLGERSLPGGRSAERWWRPVLRPGAEIVGPAIIEEPESTTWIGDGEKALVLEDGTIEVTW
jgi:N-methylhydantoinase A